ncbi:MAG: DUF1127 domain-containing protein [Pseudomonadota bacterium]
MQTNISTLLNRVGVFFGMDAFTKSQRRTYDLLNRLTERQLEDIGLTEGTVRAVVLGGPDAVRTVCPDGAIQSANSNARPADAA